MGVEFSGAPLEDTGNKVTSISAQSTDTQYPSAKCVYDGLEAKQGSLTFDNSPTSGSNNPVKSGGVYTALESKIPSTDKGANNGVCPLDENGKVATTHLYDYLLGQVLYGGTFSGAWGAVVLTSNAMTKLGAQEEVIQLTDDHASVTGVGDNEGIYYITWEAGTFAGIDFEVGDWLISNGTAWTKIDNTDAVSLVNGKQGNVTLTQDDVGDGATYVRTENNYTAEDKAAVGTIGDKQDALTFDDLPLEGSTNPVKSGGVFTALAGKADNKPWRLILEHTTTAAVDRITIDKDSNNASFALTKFHVFVTAPPNTDMANDSTMNLMYTTGISPTIRYAGATNPGISKTAGTTQYSHFKFELDGVWSGILYRNNAQSGVSNTITGSMYPTYTGNITSFIISPTATYSINLPIGTNVKIWG